MRRIRQALRQAPGAVRFVGFQPQNELPRYYNLCDAFVLPSVQEAWGLVVNEVMCAGRAVIASDRVGSAPDLVKPGENGAIFRVDEVDDLARAMRDVVGDPVRLAAMGRRSREIIDRWSFAEDIAGLRRALGTDQLSMVYQPIVDVRSGRTVAFEALARWTSPDLGPVSPAVFVPIAERSGLITGITEVLLVQALSAAKAWPDDVALSFNLSMADITSPQAADGIVTAGSGWADESHLTGESQPQSKREGSQVLAGAMITDGSVQYRAEQLGSRTLLGDMMAALSEAQGSKAPIARIADKVAGVFVPVVVAIGEHQVPLMVMLITEEPVVEQ